jgi:hypothetical protein
LDRPDSGDEGKVFELVYVYILLNCSTSLTGILDMAYSRGSFNWVSFQKFIVERLCTLSSRVILYPGSYIRIRPDEVISPSQTTLLKLLDSFLQSIPASFLDEGDYLRDLAGFLAAVFLFQAENGRRAIQLVTGTLSPEPKATAKANDGSTEWSSSGAADLQLSAACVALVLLSNSLSTILLSERENEGGTSADPVLVSMTLPCADAISDSRGSTSGFIEYLLGSAVPFVRGLSISMVT